MATTGGYPPAMSSSGVMSDPPPTPVRPTSTPTARPKKMIRGSTAMRVDRSRESRGRVFDVHVNAPRRRLLTLFGHAIRTPRRLLTATAAEMLACAP